MINPEIIKPYYDHDHIWRERAGAKIPAWGSYSRHLYRKTFELLSHYGGNPRSESLELLDVGCGAGLFADFFRDTATNYTGIDASAEAIRLGNTSFPNTSLYCCDFAQEAPPEDLMRAFDMITCLNTLHCLVEEQDRHTFLSNLNLCAKPSACLVLTTMSLPIVEGYRRSKAPRCYRSTELISHELRASGWKNILLTETSDLFGRRKITNLTIVASNGDS